MTFNLGQRIRTLINLESADWDTQQPDIPAGSLGTIDRLPGITSAYGVMLDGDVHRLGVSMAPGEIEAV